MEEVSPSISRITLAATKNAVKTRAMFGVSNATGVE